MRLLTKVYEDSNIHNIAPFWCETMLGYVSLDYPLPHKLTVFLELRFPKTVRFSEQVVSADKYSRISLQQMGAVSDNALLRPATDLKLIRDFLKVIQKPYLALIVHKINSSSARVKEVKAPF